MCVSPYLRSVYSVKKLSKIRRQGHQHLWPLSGHVHQTNGGFWIGLSFGREYQVDGVRLGFPS